MSKKDKIIGDLLTGGIVLGTSLVYLLQRKLIKEKDKIIEDQYEMLDKANEQVEELINMNADLLGFDEKDKEKLERKATFRVVDKEES